MLFTLFSVALFVAASISGVSADFAISSPDVKPCQKVTVSWEPTDAPPYNLIAANATDMCGEPLRDIGDFDISIAEWVVDLTEGTQFYFSVMDSKDREAWSILRTVAAGDNSCVSSSSTGSPTPGSPGGSSSTPTPSPSPSPSPSPDISPLGAANAGTLGSSAITVRQASLPIVTIAGLAVVVALL